MTHASRALGPLQTKDDDLLGSCRALCRALPSADVCLHYSLKWNYHTNAERSFKAFQQFCADTAALDGKASVMLVSGGGKKRKLDTVGVGSDSPLVTITDSALSMRSLSEVVRSTCGLAAGQQLASRLDPAAPALQAHEHAEEGEGFMPADIPCLTHSTLPKEHDWKNQE